MEHADALKTAINSVYGLTSRRGCKVVYVSTDSIKVSFT